MAAARPDTSKVKSETSSGKISTPKEVQSSRGAIPKRVPPETPKAKSKLKQKYDEISNLRVAVRVRPMNIEELSISGIEDVIRFKNNEIIVRKAKDVRGINTDHTFQYDHVFWSVDENDSSYASQEDVFISLGVPLLNSAFRGINACLFAYGQTGSGKTYCMMGGNIENGNNMDLENVSGITPRFCKELFKRIGEQSQDIITEVEISYFEIYNEKIHDLLAESTEKVPLKVREHPHLGPYIAGLTMHAVKSYQELVFFLNVGIKNRITAATILNELSSRSHSIFCIEISQSERANTSNSCKKSKVNLVDLAGSERFHPYSKQERTKEGVFINKSLMTLKQCISALTDQKKATFVPYRNSTLTWLLRESLGGNSLTSMLATISPSNIHIEETLATLRYACQARSVINRVHINENSYDRIIRELTQEVERLNIALATRNCEPNVVSISRRSTATNTITVYNGITWAQLEIIRTAFSDFEQKFEVLLELNGIQAKQLMSTKDAQDNFKSKLTHNVQPQNNATDVNGNAVNDERLEMIRRWCAANNLIYIRNDNSLEIINPDLERETEISFENVALINLENGTNFFDASEWRDTENLETDTKLTTDQSKSEVTETMKNIYGQLAKLQPSENEYDLHHLYAKTNQLLQRFETDLLKHGEDGDN